MKSKAFFFLFICALLIIDDVSAKFKISFGRSSGRISHGSSRGTSNGGYSRGTSLGTSYGGASRGTSLGNSHGGSISNQRIGSYGSPSNTPSVSRPIGNSPGPITSQQNKNINTQLLSDERGGAIRPAQTNPSQPHINPYPAMPAPVSSIGGKPGVVTERKQTSPFQPSAPQDHVIKSTTGTLQNQGHLPNTQTNPPWSNPYLGANKPTAPAQTYPPWSNPHLGVNKPPALNSQPAVLGAQPPPIGFKDHVYPHSYPSSASTQFNPSISGRPPYPTHPMPSGNPWSGPSISPPLHKTNSMPLGNPYSMHTPGGAYGTYGGAHSVPGQPYYPQQTHVLAQPAVQPFIPGQTILMVPGQQSSGPGFGQMVKEALVFSTINAGVNRLINPHTHHYVESKPDTAPTTTTHITYNNQYFNTPPGVNGTMNPTNIPQGTGPSNYPNGGISNIPQGTGPTNSYPSGVSVPNAGGSDVSSGNVNSYFPNTPNSGVSSSNLAGRVNGNLNTPTTGSKVTSDQQNISKNSVSVDNTLLYRISNDELYKISEELFAKNTLNISKYIKLNLQTRVTSSNITDEAKEPLFNVEPELLEYPSIYVTRSLYNSYEYDFRKKLNRTLETRKQENLFIDTFLNTNEMVTAMQWLADRGFIDPDDFERKDVLRRIWFTIFSGSTCGFERVFASENYNTAIVGIQDWIYFENQESMKRINYMGYVDKLNLGSTASLLKLNFQMDGIVRPNGTIFVGTLPELEMSLYTICFYARPNDLCPVSLGGTKFNIYTHSFTYFGNEVIDLGLPMF